MTAEQRFSPPFPRLVRNVLRRTVPTSVFQRYVGRHEGESLAWWIWLASRVAPSESILDIGAFHGEYALAARAANPTVAVYAFEPNPTTWAVLQCACDGTGITTINAGVTTEDGRLAFECRSAESQLIDVAADAGSNDVVMVDVVALDRWCARDGVLPALMKIDVEGHEAAVLSGGHDVLSRCRPTILCEVLSNAAGDAVMRRLPPRYRYYRIDENRGIAEEKQLTRSEWRNKNWLCVPAERAPEVLKLEKAGRR